MGSPGAVYTHDSERQKRWEFLMGTKEELTADILSHGTMKRLTESRLDYVRIGAEMLLENTMRQIAMDVGDKSLLDLTPEKFFEEIDTSSIVPFTRFALPLVRRVVPRIYAKSLVGFQPMPMPTGKIFYLDITYGGQQVSGNGGYSKYPTYGVQAVSANTRVDLVANMNPQYGGARRFVSAVGTNTNPQVVPLLDQGAKNIQWYIDGVLQLASTLTNTPGATSLSTQGTVDSASIAAAVPTTSVITIQYDNQLEGQVANDINMSMESKNIEAEAIKLRSAMTVETMQDFAAYHGVESETELTNAMAAEVDREIDRNIIDRLYFNAGAGNVNWDTNGYLVGDDNSFFRREYRRTLYEAIVATNNLIYRKRFVNASWIVGGVGAIERLEKLERFVINTSQDAPDDGQVARRFEGTLDGKWAVYKDARLADTQLLMGYKGDTPFHTGAVYAPYIPAYMTDLLPDPSINFKVRKGIMSRFGFQIVIPEVYATLTLL